MPSQFFLALLVLFNAIPLYGVIAWGWQSFDLIFLYWLENLVIGVFTLLRFVVRPYRHPIDAALPLFFAPFFAFHYGMFCLVHGGFVFALFAPGQTATGLFAPLQQIPALLSARHLGVAAMGLVALQLVDWFRDIREAGLGSGDSVLELMTRPYRRIVVLHLTIIASGFLLLGLQQPAAGLLLLVLLKTGFDVWNWRRDEARAAAEAAPVDLALDPEMLRRMEEKLPEPRLTVNGRDVRFRSFQDYRDSKYFRMLGSIMRLMGKGREYRAIEAYVDMKIAQERGP